MVERSGTHFLSVVMPGTHSVLVILLSSCYHMATVRIFVSLRVCLKHDILFRITALAEISTAASID